MRKPAFSNNPPSAGKLGTFAGVFTPSILTILGIILFLRLGYVVGSAGLAKGLVIIALANAISVMTSISLSAVATNLRVKGGGDYYLISRTLGVAFGGAIGLVLFLAQSVSIAFYCIGFAEAMSSLFPLANNSAVQIIAAGAVTLLLIFAWKGADWATRFQFGVMALLILALLSFFIGGIRNWDTALLAANWATPENGAPFWVLFAIFFPAVTGFTQGVSMSGDLADPGKSIPLGTFLAVGASILVYFGVSILFAATTPNDVLSSDYGAMKEVSAAGFFIDAGVIAATLSSAMASFMGAPRILQSLAADKVFPILVPFAKTSGPSNNPRRGVLLAAGIAFVTIALGKLNLIASVVSMFFLISYGLLNYATYFESRTQSPSFRPRFKWFSPRLSLLGFLVCAGTMLAIDPKSGTIAIALLFAVYQYLQRTAGPSRWADSSRSYHMQMVRKHLLAAREEIVHPRDWRPQLLVFTQDSDRRSPLLTFADWIQGDSGFAEAVQVIEKEGPIARILMDAAQQKLSEDIARGRHPMFSLTICSKDATQTMSILIQSSGFGPLRPNTVVTNWLGESASALHGIGTYNYVKNLDLIFRLGKNLVLFHTDAETWLRFSESDVSRRIDVWYQENATGRLMLLFAYLMTRDAPWDRATLRVLMQGKTGAAEMEEANLRKHLDEVRIDAAVQIVENFDAKTIIEKSADAHFVFLPMTIGENRILDPTGNSFARSLPRLPIAAVVMAAEDIDLDAEPEQGLPALVSRVADDLETARKNAQSAIKEVLKAQELVEKQKKRIKALEEKGVSGAVPLDERQSMMEKLEEADRAAQKAQRRASRAKAQADDAAFAAKMLNPEMTMDEPNEEKKG